MSIITECQKRFLTTHVGSLPRPVNLSSTMALQMEGRLSDEVDYEAEVRTAVRECVHWQCKLGIDIVSDGEQSKVGFSTYVQGRLSGLKSQPEDPSILSSSREIEAFPEYYCAGHSGARAPRAVCAGPISYVGLDLLKTDLENLKAAVEGQTFVDVFIPSASIATIEGTVTNLHYQHEEDYLEAIGEAMRVEYEAIVEAGFSVQLDDPFIAMHYMLNPRTSIEEARAWAQRRIDALNYSVRNIPLNKIRHHTCYGINMGPRTSDLEMKYLVDKILSIKADFYSFEFANPRHEHECEIWNEVKLPDGKMLIPGVVTHTSVLVEHPELVAQRIVRFANSVGREHVIASTDCGFASSPRAVPEVHPTIVKAKLESLVEGAHLASKQVFR